MFRRSRWSGSTARPCSSRRGAGSSSALGPRRRGRRSERRPKRCFRAASSLACSATFSARSRATSASSWRTIACKEATSSGSRAPGARVEASMPDETPPAAAGSAILPGRGREALEAADAGQVDAVEDHLELAGREFEGGGPGGGLGEVVAAGLEPLAPQAQAVAAPVQDLEPVGGAVAEDEQV